MPVRFEWDGDKAVANVRKHQVSFEEAATVFGDPLASTFPDPRHSTTEPRLVAIGFSERGRLIVVLFIERLASEPEEPRTGTIRIISARKATRAERRAYEEGI